MCLWFSRGGLDVSLMLGYDKRRQDLRKSVLVLTVGSRGGGGDDRREDDAVLHVCSFVSETKP